jgi:tetrahydromethanopterin S-methyltransferase subunit G
MGEARQSDFRGFGERLTDVDRRIDDLRSDMNRGFQELREETRFGFRDYGKRMDSLETRLDHLGAGT